MTEELISGLSKFDIRLADKIVQTELAFLTELLRWNQRINLTSIKNRSEALEKHLIDSLVLLPYLGGAKNLIDLGSGGGLPGIPLAIAAPTLKVVSVDSIGKKVNFQRHIKRTFSLDNLLVIQSRAESLDQTSLEQKSFDLIVARAFTSLEPLLGYANPWLMPGGRVIAMKGRDGNEELKSAERIINQYEFTTPVVCSYELPYSHAERQLIILTKK